MKLDEWEGLCCRLTDTLAPLPHDTRVIDGDRWPTSWAGYVAARYMQQYGPAGAMSRRAVCDHVAAVCGWPPS